MKSTFTNIRLYLVLIALLFALPALVNAQTLSGKLTDVDGPLIGATISVTNGQGVVTDIDGNYTLKLEPGRYIATASYLGYEDQVFEFTVGVDQTKTWNAQMSADAVGLESVVVVGSRTAARSSTTTPLPIDVLRASELTNTGQNTFDKALTYTVPSFNSVNTPVNDATSLLDPYEIRNMGPSRTLILVNGKRKNMSALLYTQTSPGRGETGADISGIPQDAIKRVEILRDGASAQYGSDAIAGVMNIILKDNIDLGSFTVRGGFSSDWGDNTDGGEFGISLNNGATLPGGGFVNYTIDLGKRFQSNRPGMVSAEGEAMDFIGGADGDAAVAAAEIAEVQRFLDVKPDAGNINGNPETTAAKFSLNGGFDIGEKTDLYYNGIYTYKKVNSFANYRTPYWRTIEAFPYLQDFFGEEFGIDYNGDGNKTYAGYVPTFDGDLADYTGTIGLRTNINGWIADVSFTAGANEQTYLIRNSHNRNGNAVNIAETDSTTVIQIGEAIAQGGEVIPVFDTVPVFDTIPVYRENSQLVFDPGGTRFDHIVGNLDVTRRLSDVIGIAFGAEFRSETFTVIEGGLSSYDDGGPDSFSGNDPRNSGIFNRYNFGGYLDFAFDFTEDFLLNLTGRAENYSDFGGAFVWKASTRYKLMEDQLTFRASASTGFKAPTLHQIFTQRAQYSFVPGQGIQVGGLVSNVSREARLLQLPALAPEKSTNFTVGLGFKPSRNFSLTLDYYNIAVTDRIILSTEIGGTAFDEDGNNIGTTRLDEILREGSISDISFFVNGMDTRTSGIDFVTSYRGLALGAGSLGFNLSGNYTLQNERVGEVKDPELVKEAGQTVSNGTQEALFFTSRPEFKAILGIDYNLDKFKVVLSNTLFGPTYFENQGLQDLENFYDDSNPADADGGSDLGVSFKSKVVTDLLLSYQATEKVGISLNINNLLNILPEREFVAITETGQRILDDTSTNEYGITNQQIADNLITFNQRYSQMTYDGYHFSQLGTLLNLAVNVKF